MSLTKLDFVKPPWPWPAQTAIILLHMIPQRPRIVGGGGGDLRHLIFPDRDAARAFCLSGLGVLSAPEFLGNAHQYGRKSMAEYPWLLISPSPRFRRHTFFP